MKKIKILFVLFCMPLSFHAWALDFTLSTIDAQRSIGDASSRNTGIDSEGHVHVVYGGNAVYYARFNGSTWETQALDESCVQTTGFSLAISSSDYLHISYYCYDGTSASVKYIRSTNAGNTFESPATLESDTSFTQGQTTSVLVNNASEVFVVYFEGSNYYRIKYAESGDDGGSFASPQIVAGTEASSLVTSSVLDSAGNIHILYSGMDNSGTGVIYIKITNSGIVGSPTILDAYSDFSLNSTPSIAVDSGDLLHVSYYDGQTDDLNYLKLNNDGAILDTITVDSSGDVGYDSSIFIDSSDNIFISYFDATNEDLKFARYPAGGGAFEAPVGALTDGFFYGTSDYDNVFSSLVVSSSGTIHIIANPKKSADNASLLFDLVSTDNGVTFASPVLIDGEYGSAGRDNSIALGVDGRVYISNYDSIRGNLQFQKSEDGGVTVSEPLIVDSTGDVGQYSSIATDSSGNIHIAYYDVTNANLKYAQSSDGGVSFTILSTPIDSTGNVGQYSSIATDSSGNIHIAYYDVTNGNLKYAQSSNRGASFTVLSTPVDSDGDVGRYSSIATDSSGNIHIAYYDVTNGNLKYAQSSNGGASFTVLSTPVDSTGNVGQYSSIATDSSGNIHIAYYDVTNANLKYAQSSDGGLSFSTPVNIDEEGRVGLYADLAVDSVGNIHIAYQDGYKSHLKYAYAVDYCDGLDNDGDGTADEGFDVGGDCTVGVGVCVTAGVYVCSGDTFSSECDATAGSPTTELCDGLDNDCDGTADEGFDVDGACTVGVGGCATVGVYVCSGDTLSSECDATAGSPTTEICDSIDNDCDGTADEDFTDLGDNCSAGVGLCADDGAIVCSEDGLATVCDAVAGEATTEVCGDDIDQDCDGSDLSCTCGDGVVTSPEECDDGELTSTCSSTCQSIVVENSPASAGGCSLRR